MDVNFPQVASCVVRNDKNKVCNAAAQFDSYNPAQQHAFYRCLKPECRGLSVVCYNQEHNAQ